MSLYSEYGAMDSQVDPSEFSFNNNMDTKDLTEEAKKVVDDIFGETSGTSSTNAHSYQLAATEPAGRSGPGSIPPVRNEIQPPNNWIIEGDGAQAPQRFKAPKMGHIASPTKMDYTETMSPTIGDFSEYVTSAPSSGGNRQPPMQAQQPQAPLQAPRGGTGGSPQANPASPQQNRNQGSPAAQTSGSNGPHLGTAERQLMTMGGEDRWNGYPPPGRPMTEHEREAHFQAEAQNPSAQRSLRAGTDRAAGDTLPIAAEDLTAVIFSGYLFKQNRRGQFQKRLFRFDGLLLICLGPKKHKLPDHINLMTFDPERHARSGAANEFASALKRFYPTNPPMPALTNPLLASFSEGKDSSNPDVYTKYYHMPKWIIPTAAIQSIESAVQNPARDPESKASRTFILHTSNREYVLRAPTAAEYRRWTFLLSRMSVMGGDAPKPTAAPSHVIGSIARENDEDDDESDDEPIAIDPITSSAQHPATVPPPVDMGPIPSVSVTPVMDPSHPSLARMGAWQKSVADLLGRDRDAHMSVMSVSNSEGSPTIERGLSNRQSRLTNSTMSSADGYRYPPETVGAPPVPAIPHGFPQGSPKVAPAVSPATGNAASTSLPPSQMPAGSSPQQQPSQPQVAPPQQQPPQPQPQPQQYQGNRNQSPLAGTFPNGGPSGPGGPFNGPAQPAGPRAYPMPVPLRPDQLQPPPGRVMRGPTIFGAAIAAGVHPTTPMMPGAVRSQSINETSPSPENGGPLKKGASVRHMNRTADRMSIISTDGFVVPGGFVTKLAGGGPSNSSPLNPARTAAPTQSFSSTPVIPSPTPAQPSQPAQPSRLSPAPPAAAANEDDINVIGLDPAAQTDLSRQCNSLLRVLIRILGDDGDESSLDPTTRRNVLAQLQSGGRMAAVRIPDTPVLPGWMFLERFVAVAVPHFAGKILVHLEASGRRKMVARFEKAVGEWSETVVKGLEGSKESRVAWERLKEEKIKETITNMGDLVLEIRKKVLA
ncbi:hypothetical protein HDU96_005822 [Phlyctochytrium bullatum]|nr:hypothetical protein HDU96_005822 [Phlyctochytrium bullatum]